MTAQSAIFRSGSLDESKPGNPLDYVSHSRLRSYLTCRWKFYLEKILALKAPTSPNLQVGKAVHSALQAWHLAKWRGEETSVEKAQDAYVKSYDELESADPVDYDGKDRQECIETGNRVLQAYLESNEASDRRRILGVEAYLRREEGELALPLVGVVDLVAEGNVPIDFKTVGATPVLSDEAWQNELQMTAYHILLEDATGETPGQGELIYLVKLKNPKVIRQQLPSVDQKQVDRFRALVDAYADGISREDYYPSPGMHCRWCPYKSQCKSWTGSKAQAA